MKNRFLEQEDWDREAPLTDLDPADLNPAETLFLAVHGPTPLLDQLREVHDERMLAEWTNKIAAAFAGLLEHCDLDRLDDLTPALGSWTSLIHPPSVLQAQLLMFLGRLSADNNELFLRLERRGSIQAYLLVVQPGSHWFEDGKQQRQRYQ